MSNVFNRCCVVCGKLLFGRKRKFCSRECTLKWYRWSWLRRETLKRDNMTCQVCGRRPPEVEVEVHHILPRKRGGADELENLITLCHDCHRKIMHTKKNEMRTAEKYKSKPLSSWLKEERYL